MIDKIMTQSIVDVEKSVTARTSKIMKGWFIWLMALLAIFSFSTFIIFSWTNVFRDTLVSNLVIRNNSQLFSWWQSPPVQAFYKIRIFNYTNYQEFMTKKEDKLRVEEVGPYIYREKLTRVNPVFFDNGTITYQEHREFVYIGGRSEDDILMVPNLLMFLVASFIRGKIYTYSIVNILLPKHDFIEWKTAKNFIWGEESVFFTLARFIKTDIPVDRLGLLTIKDGLSKDRITIHTGQKNIANLGVFDNVNGEKSRNVWGDETCDKISGTDGTMFPPHLINEPNSTQLYIYSREMCRSIPLKYEGPAFAQGLPTLRYRFADDVFNVSIKKDPCYCLNRSDESSCPPRGIFNNSRCYYNTPFLTSFPHFYLGDEALFKHVDGLNPKKELHESYIDIHPRLALPVDGISRLQINLEVRKDNRFKFAREIDNGQILPLLWLEIGVEPISGDILSLLHHAFYTANAVEALFQWGSLICFIFSSCYLFRFLSTKQFKRSKMLHRNTSGQGPLIEEQRNC